MTQKKKVAVVAIGGNSLIRDKSHQSVGDQYDSVKETSGHIAEMIQQGWDVAISHGNGPQVGFILRRSELAAHELHEIPLDVCGADTQGAIGYALQQNLYNHFLRMGIQKQIATVVTQVEVSADDPAFDDPSKPIGTFMDEPMAERRRTKDGWDVVEDAGRGWRRVVASPLPIRIVEEDAVEQLLNAGICVVTVGGGGIPVIAGEDGYLSGVPAVIDKDFASALLASNIGAELLVITTAVEKVALNFGTPEQKWVGHMTMDEAKGYLAEGIHFAKGSMAPKIQAAINFLEAGGKRVVITDPPNIEEGINGETGTTITA
jgi:carbamate kinase